MVDCKKSQDYHVSPVVSCLYFVLDSALVGSRPRPPWHSTFRARIRGANFRRDMDFNPECAKQSTFVHILSQASKSYSAALRRRDCSHYSSSTTSYSVGAIPHRSLALSVSGAQTSPRSDSSGRALAGKAMLHPSNTQARYVLTKLGSNESRE